jgi:phage shock protein PspC (stress-responsive transcriptional regulator)
MQPPGNQTFYRGSDRILGGVSSGLAEGLHIDVLWVRIAFVVLVFIQGVGLVLYLVLWVLMPERAAYGPAGQTVFGSMGNDVRRAWADLRTQFGGTRTTTPSAAPATADPTPPLASAEASVAGRVGTAVPPAPVPPQPVTRKPSFVVGAILIVVGIALLAANNGLVDWSVIWPVALIVLGIAVLVRNLEKRT